MFCAFCSGRVVAGDKVASVYSVRSVPAGWLLEMKWLLYVLCVLLEDVAREDSDTVRPQTSTCERDTPLRE
jgi:hypothetical protein